MLSCCAAATMTSASCGPVLGLFKHMLVCRTCLPLLRLTRQQPQAGSCVPVCCARGVSSSSPLT